MELINGQWRCKLCHAEIAAQTGARHSTAFETRGGESLRRVIRDGGTIVHTCVPSWVRPKPVASH